MLIALQAVVTQDSCETDPEHMCTVIHCVLLCIGGSWPLLVGRA